MIGPFMGTVSTTTPLVAYDERGITNLASTNARWLPNLTNEGVRYVHYFAHRVRRQFGLDQHVPYDFTLVLILSLRFALSSICIPLIIRGSFSQLSRFLAYKEWAFVLPLCMPTSK